MTGTGGIPACIRFTDWMYRVGKVQLTGVTAKASGVSFVFMKATEGGDFTDPMFDEHRRGAQAAGVPWGAYHYYYFCRSGPRTGAVGSFRMSRKVRTLPHVSGHGMDAAFENLHPAALMAKSSGPRRKSSSISSNGTMVADPSSTRRWTFYAGYRHRTACQRPSSGCARSRDILARSIRGAVWRFWQYTGTGLVPGVQGKVDINVVQRNSGSLGQLEVGELGVRCSVGLDSTARHQMAQSSFAFFTVRVAQPERLARTQLAAFKPTLAEAPVHLIDFALHAQLVVNRNGNGGSDNNSPKKDIGRIAPMTALFPPSSAS